MKITFVRVILTLALLWGGGQGLYTALANRSPKEISMAEYLAAKPSAKWLRLTGGELDLSELVYSGGRLTGVIDEVYLPLLVDDDAASGSHVQVLVASKDPALLALATKIRDAKNELETLQLLIKHEGVDLKRPVQGLVRYGIELKDKEERKLRELNENLAQDFVVLAEGESPEFGFSLAMFSGGLVLVLLMGKGVKAAPAAPTPPPLPGAVPPPTLAASPAPPEAGRRDAA